METIQQRKTCDIQEIVTSSIEEVTGVSVEEMQSLSRQRQIVFCRFIVTWELYKRTNMEYMSLSEFLHKDVGTVAYYLKRYEDDYGNFPQFRRMADRIKECIDGKV